MMVVREMVGETRITGKGQISLPACGLRAMSWAKGDHLLVERLGDDVILLMKRPTSWTDAFAGKLSHLFGDLEANVAFVRGERATWESDASGGTD